MSRRLLLLPAVAVLLPLLLGGCEQAAPTAPDAAVPTSTELALSGNGVSTRYSVSGGVYDACTGEIIDVTADVTLVMTYHDDDGGGFHKVENYVMHGKGVGRTSGIEYIYVDSHNMRVNGEAPYVAWFDETGTQYFTMSRLVKVISKGSSDNRLFQHDFWFRVVDGVVTLDAWRVESLCRG